MAVEIINYLAGENGVTEKIKKAMYDAARQFVYIGFLLWEVKEYHYYVTGGYKDVYDYAAQELGFKRSSTKNFIAVASTFGNYYYGKFNEKTAQKPTMSLKPEYKEFNYSQLVEMLSLSETKRQEITPNMTIKQIREKKKEVGQTSGQEPEFPLEPMYETTPIETYVEKKNTERILEYTITLDRADWEIIIEQLTDNIKYNYGDPEEITRMTWIRDEIQGIINYKEEG